MKTSELIAVWSSYGAPAHALTRTASMYALDRGTDIETGTTAELLALSERFEREDLPFTPPPAICTSCDIDSEDVSRDWVHGHRPDWQVCAQCMTVLPCRCKVPDDHGRCEGCGRLMTNDAIQKYKQAREEREREHRILTYAYGDDNMVAVRDDRGQKIWLRCTACNWSLQTVLPIVDEEYCILEKHAELHHGNIDAIDYFLYVDADGPHYSGKLEHVNKVGSELPEIVDVPVRLIYVRRQE